MRKWISTNSPSGCSLARVRVGWFDGASSGNPMDVGGISPWLEFLVFPIAAALIGNLVVNVGRFVGEHRRLRHRQIVLTAGLRDEIASIRKENAKQREGFDAALESGLFLRRIAADPRYYPHIAIARSHHVVFDTSRTDFSFLRARCFNGVVEGYDEFALLEVQLQDCRTPEFRDLPPDRKHKGLEMLTEQFAAVEASMANAAALLAEEQARLEPGRFEAILLRIKNRE